MEEIVDLRKSSVQAQRRVQRARRREETKEGVAAELGKFSCSVAKHSMLPLEDRWKKPEWNSKVLIRIRGTSI